MGFNLEKHHEWVMASLDAHPRQDLWARLGFDGPLDKDSAIEWIVARARDQRVEGDRVRLYVPPWLWRAVDWDTERDRAEDAFVGRRVNSQRAYNAWLGIYLPERDFGPAAERNPSYYPGMHWRWGKMQPLAVVALAALDVATMTGCFAEEATAWLLCDVPIPAREIVAHFHTGKPRHGVTVWVPDWQINAERLAKLFVQQRRWLTKAEQRSRRPEEKTAELIEYVERVRPHRGRHPDNLTWPEVFKEWNGAYPEWSYETADSIERAYKATRKRREERGILPPREAGE